MRRYLDAFALIWQIPLFVLSFAFFRLVRWSIRKGAASVVRKRLREPADVQWIPMAALLKQRHLLPFMMVTGPRWNCHATMGGLGPFEVKESLEIHTAGARESAAQWTLVIYRGDDHETDVAVGSSTDDGREWKKLALTPGLYRIVLRYYGSRDAAVFPAVRIDGDRLVPACAVDGEAKEYSRYLASIRNKYSVFYLALHYYVYLLLRWRKVFPDRMVRGEFLPVGNPETEFHYGSIRKGQRIELSAGAELFDEATVHLTMYNVCSFPVYWESLAPDFRASPPAPRDGSFLIRVQRHRGCTPGGNFAQLQIQLRGQ